MFLNRSFPVLLALAGALPGLHAGTEILTVTGKGSSPVASVRKEVQASAEESALDKAESAALRAAFKMAVLQVFGDAGRKTDGVLEDLEANAGSMVLLKQVTSSQMVGNLAQVEMTVKLDAGALSNYLRDRHGLSLASQLEAKARLIVLTYTIEGMDPDKSKPITLHEEVRDNRKNVQASSFSRSDTAASAHSEAESLQASKASSSKGSVEASEHASFRGRAAESASIRGEGIGARAASSAAVDAHASSSAKGNWDERSAEAVDARSQSARSSFKHSAASGSRFSDTSTSYYRVTDYADPTKKGAGVSNEVKASLEGMLHRAGFTIQSAVINLMGCDFKTEDDLLATCRREIVLQPGIQNDDMVLVGLNRFTPVDTGSHRYTAEVTYRMMRVKDGELFLPSQMVDGDSGPQASDDVGRTRAVQAAMKKVEAALPNDLREAVKRTQRMETRMASTYVVRISNSATPGNSGRLRQAIKKGGYKVSQEFKGDAQIDLLRIDLGDASLEQLKELLEPMLDGFTVKAMDDHELQLWVK